jgi:ribosomal-protein-alanine N-acetyltransferase
MRQVALRPATPADLESLEALESACFDPPWSARDLRQALATERGDVSIASGPDGGALGYSLFLRLGEEAELLRLAVLPAERGRGIGSRLLAEALDRLALSGIRRFWLEVRPSNLTARRLYERHGFRLEGTRRRYYSDGEDALLYARAERSERGSGAG